MVVKNRKASGAFMFVLVGVFVLAISIYSIHVTKSMDGVAVAIVSDVVKSQEWVQNGDDSSYETVYTQFVTYEVDGVKYENVELGECSKDTKVGDVIQIAFDTKDPTRITTPDIKVPIATSILSVLAILFGIWQMIKKKARG